jgi:3-hydroxy-9,10-secoandrosta-1,3,5(10)-triene-9,17-dione monooxygenase reductase component
MSMDSGVFRRVMGCFATGVTVVATRQPDGKPCGLTANAVTSVSLVPPLVLVCVDKRSETYPHFATAGTFTVNMLTEDQRDLSSRFAVSGGDKFNEVAFHWGQNGAPIIEGCLAYLECRIVHAYEGGDHTIYVGEVATGGSVEARPLLFYKGAYGSLADGASPAKRSAPPAR